MAGIVGMLAAGVGFFFLGLYPVGVHLRQASSRRYRRWHQAGHRFLVRADDRRVTCGGKRCLLSDLKAQLRRGRKLQPVGLAGAASYHGKPATLWVAELAVVLDRPAKKKIDGKSV